VAHCYTLPDVGCSDHCVIAVEVNLEGVQPVRPVRTFGNQSVNWNFERKDLVTQFYMELDCILTRASPEISRLTEMPDQLCETITESVVTAGTRVFGYKKTNRFNIPGWNERAKLLNINVKHAVLDWNVANRPREGPIAERMRSAKAAFRAELKTLRQNENQLRANALLRKIQDGSCKDFWKEIKKLNPKKESLPVSVSGVSGDANIAKLWREHFSEIANSVRTDSNKGFVMAAMTGEPQAYDPVSVREVQSIVSKLKTNKAIGSDGIPSEVYKYASRRLLTLLSILISACLKSSVLPRKLMHVTVIPILKCKSKDPSDMSNYRPIAIATAISKVVEQVLLYRLKSYLWTEDSQFGFKEKLGTEMAIFTLKQTSEYYTRHGSPVFACFLDAKKAFDRVNHWTMLKILLQRDVPLYIAKILCYWFRTQNFIVKWGNCLSEPYKCINGIRQGGQLSPLLYNVYTNELNALLNNSRVGCYIGDVCVNSISYADDMVLLAPTRSALQELLVICEEFSRPHDIIYNTTKTVCMLMKPDNSRCSYATGVVLNDVPLVYVDEFKYLGHIITSDGRDDRDISKQFRRQNAVGNMLVRKFGFAPKEAKIRLFKSYCYPIYGNSLWRSYYQYSMNKLSVSYNDTFKQLMCEPRFVSSSAVFAQNYTDHLKVVLRKSSYSLWQRLLASDNRLVAALCSSDSFHQSRILQTWQDMIFI